MDGNSAKKAPVLDHLVSTNNAPAGNAHNGNYSASASTPQQTQATPVLASMNNTSLQSEVPPEPQAKPPKIEDLPQDRRTDKSQFEIELTNTVNKIMIKHFEHASEQIVQQVLSEVRARLPGQRKT